MRPPARTSVPALVLLLAACGTGPSQEESERVVDRFQAAMGDANGSAACAELTEHLRSTLEAEEGKPCSAAIVGLGLNGTGRAASSRVYTTSALVSVAGGGEAFLDQTEQGWRISAAGCVRVSGQEYQCRLED